MLHEMGVETGIDLPAPAAARVLGSRAAGAGPAAREPHAGRGAGRVARGRGAGPRLLAADGLLLLGVLRFARALARRGDAVLLDGDLHLQRSGRGSGRAEASITRLARPTATGEFASSSSTSAARRRLELVGRDHAVDQTDPLALLPRRSCARS